MLIKTDQLIANETLIYGVRKATGNVLGASVLLVEFNNLLPAICRTEISETEYKHAHGKSFQHDDKAHRLMMDTDYSINYLSACIFKNYCRLHFKQNVARIFENNE